MRLWLLKRKDHEMPLQKKTKKLNHRTMKITKVLNLYFYIEV